MNRWIPQRAQLCSSYDERIRLAPSAEVSRPIPSANEVHILKFDSLNYDVLHLLLIKSMAPVIKCRVRHKPSGMPKLSGLEVITRAMGTCDVYFETGAAGWTELW